MSFCRAVRDPDSDDVLLTNVWRIFKECLSDEGFMISDLQEKVRTLTFDLNMFILVVMVTKIFS